MGCSGWVFCVINFEDNCDSIFGSGKYVRATEQTKQKGRHSSPAIEYFRLKCAWGFELCGSQWACSDVLLLPNITSSYLQSHYAIVVFTSKRALKWDIKYMHYIIRTKSLLVDCTLRVGC